MGQLGLSRKSVLSTARPASNSDRKIRPMGHSGFRQIIPGPGQSSCGHARSGCASQIQPSLQSQVIAPSYLHDACSRRLRFLTIWRGGGFVGVQPADRPTSRTAPAWRGRRGRASGGRQSRAVAVSVSRSARRCRRDPVRPCESVASGMRRRKPTRIYTSEDACTFEQRESEPMSRLSDTHGSSSRAQPAGADSSLRPAVPAVRRAGSRRDTPHVVRCVLSMRKLL
jgi:hypothetical protein